jgi:hypothetical protein
VIREGNWFGSRLGTRECFIGLGDLVEGVQEGGGGGGEEGVRWGKGWSWEEGGRGGTTVLGWGGGEG